MRTYRQKIILSVVILAAVTAAWAIPGYRIADEKAARKAVRQYAGDSSKFGAVVYQSELDKNVWRLALAAHDYLQQKPSDPERKCSFAMAYWRSQEVTEVVPPEARKQLAALFEEAHKDTQEAVAQLPGSATAHLNYGQFLLLFVPGMAKVKPMLHEFQTAVSLKPRSGQNHYWLAEGYAGSGDASTGTVDKILTEAKKAVSLDPRLANSYYLMASVNDWPSHRNLKMSRFYLNKFILARPNQVSRPDVVAFQKYLQEDLKGR